MVRRFAIIGGQAPYYIRMLQRALFSLWHFSCRSSGAVTNCWTSLYRELPGVTGFHKVDENVMATHYTIARTSAWQDEKTVTKVILRSSGHAAGKIPPQMEAQQGRSRTAGIGNRGGDKATNFAHQRITTTDNYVRATPTICSFESLAFNYGFSLYMFFFIFCFTFFLLSRSPSSFFEHIAVF